MMGTIELEQIRIRCIVGIHDFERVQEQSVGIDVAMETDFAEAAATEHIDATVDYSAVARELTELAVQRRFQLIETMAEEAAKLVLERFPRVSTVGITVHKPAAVPEATDTRVKVVRSR